MERQVYITEEERSKCQKVAEALTELYEMESIVVLDAGRYGFVMMRYYTPDKGFDESGTFTDSKSHFDALWEEWLNTKLYLMAKGTPLLESGYKGVLESLSDEKRAALIERKADFALRAGISP